MHPDLFPIVLYCFSVFAFESTGPWTFNNSSSSSIFTEEGPTRLNQLHLNVAHVDSSPSLFFYLSLSVTKCGPCSSLSPGGARTWGCVDRSVLCAPRDTATEKTYLCCQQQPMHTALVSRCLFGIHTRTPLHPTLLFKCQLHTSERQIDWRLISVFLFFPSSSSSTVPFAIQFWDKLVLL